MAPKSNAEKQRDFRQRMIKAGYKQVCVWVPDGRQKDIRQIATEMRDEQTRADAKGK